ncbi:MAG: SDR family oxidoreductase [Candidatus Eisenbacteria bacterium]|uniref:SDR family oxidoreductase n=1 Tax=Eiseniibacteriota bacterium TaxID=2212470 RepID=A0A956SBX3_UNCEI|nr:SDR family oxidoreductase [Candidatus Eisenbacteria bacterium]MCB9464662.1 SDR family oxidoreductase [Candidatus Eisenbacteria bacterium]
MKLENVRALITGGGTGIGKETARLLVEGGAKVVITGRRKDVLEEAAREVGAIPVVLDVRSEDEVRNGVSQAVEKLGGLNVLVNNAGFGNFGPLLELDVQDFREVMETNVFGAMLMAKEAARHFVEHGGGNIINVSSTAGSRGFAGGTAYTASKFALGAMTECWRAELRKHEVRVMQVNPSEVLTDFGKTAGYEQKQSEKKLRPLEIAHAIKSMLEMDDRGFITELTVFATNPD